MIKIHSSPTLFEVHNLKNVLESEGIACEIRGEYRKAGAGELPPIETWAELWIEDDREEARAKELLTAHANAPTAPPWTCASCGEQVGEAFAQCWNCETPRPAV